MKKRRKSMAGTVAVSVAAGMALGALGAVGLPAVTSSKFMKQAKKTIKNSTDRAMDTIEDITGSVSRFF